MFVYVLRRILFSIPVLLVASFLLFCVRARDLRPDRSPRATSAIPSVDRSARRERLGLNDPIPVQYGKWLGDFVQGDWGESARTREPVTDMTARALWNTLQLIIWGIVLSAIIAVSHRRLLRGEAVLDARLHCSPG